MAFDTDEVILLGFLDEILFQFRRREVEGNVHHASVLHISVAFVETAALVDGVINKSGFYLISFFNRFEPAHIPDPVKHPVQRVNAEDRRRVVCGIILDESLVLEVFRNIRPCFFKKAFF